MVTLPSQRQDAKHQPPHDHYRNKPYEIITTQNVTAGPKKVNKTHAKTLKASGGVRKRLTHPSRVMVQDFITPLALLINVLRQMPLQHTVRLLRALNWIVVKIRTLPDLLVEHAFNDLQPKSGKSFQREEGMPANAAHLQQRFLLCSSVAA